MHPKNELFSTLSPEDVPAHLSACVLLEKEEYTEDEVYRFREGLSMRQQGKSYEEISQMFEKQGLTLATEPQPSESQPAEPEPQSKNKKSRNGKKSVTKSLDISELLALASEQAGTRISLIEAGKILNACGLPDQDSYSDSECDRFLEACDLLKNQGKTYEEIAAHFGTGAGIEEIATDVEAETEETASVLDESSNGVVSEAMRYKAKADASVAPTLYLKHLANEFGSPEFQENWQQMEELLKAKIAGKSMLRARQFIGEMRAIPQLPSPSNALPAASEDGSTSD